MKAKIRKLMEEGDLLRKKELEKHEKLVKAEKKIAELEGAERGPIANELDELQK